MRSLIYFELWDIDTRNLLYDFDTEEEGLDAASELIALNSGHYPEHIALARANDDETVTWLAHGVALGERIAEYRARAKSHVG